MVWRRNTTIITEGKTKPVLLNLGFVTLTQDTFVFPLTNEPRIGGVTSQGSGTQVYVSIRHIPNWLGSLLGVTSAVSDS